MWLWQRKLTSIEYYCNESSDEGEEMAVMMGLHWACVVLNDSAEMTRACWKARIFGFYLLPDPPCRSAAVDIIKK